MAFYWCTQEVSAKLSEPINKPLEGEGKASLETRYWQLELFSLHMLSRWFKRPSETRCPMTILAEAAVIASTFRLIFWMHQLKAGMTTTTTSCVKSLHDSSHIYSDLACIFYAGPPIIKWRRPGTDRFVRVSTFRSLPHVSSLDAVSHPLKTRARPFPNCRSTWIISTVGMTMASRFSTLPVSVILSTL